MKIIALWYQNGSEIYVGEKVHEAEGEIFLKSFLVLDKHAFLFGGNKKVPTDQDIVELLKEKYSLSIDDNLLYKKEPNTKILRLNGLEGRVILNLGDFQEKK